MTKSKEYDQSVQEDDEFLASSPQDEEQAYFDSIIGALEETLMGRYFEILFTEENAEQYFV